MKSSLTNYEKYEVNKEDTQLNYTFELIQFVEKLNNNVIKYYQDSIYSYVLKRRLEKLHGHNITDERYIELLKNNYEGIMLFPNIGTNLKNNEYIEQIKRDLLYLTKSISFNKNANYYIISNFLAKGDLGFSLKYQDCVASARELLLFEENNIKEYINRIKEVSEKNGFDFKYQLNDFLDRLELFYMENKEEEKYKNLKVLRKHMITT